MKFSAVFAAASAMAFAQAASATIIDFEALPVGNQSNPLILNGATFSANEGFINIFDGVTNGIGVCASATSDANCPFNLTVDFHRPASDISFTFISNNTATVGASIGNVALFSGVTLLGNVNILVTDFDPFTKDLVALTGFSGVTSLVISNTDFGGIGYDDFAFNAVPEPAAWAMLIAGFGLVGAMARRQRSVQITA
jgi:hypothetical protein